VSQPRLAGRGTYARRTTPPAARSCGVDRRALLDLGPFVRCRGAAGGSVELASAARRSLSPSPGRSVIAGHFVDAVPGQSRPACRLSLSLSVG